MPETIIHYLKIPALEVLDETLLRDLGVINVICGKNNSGKSTILKEISDESRRKIGLALTEVDANAMARLAAEGMGLAGQSYSQHREALKFISRTAVATQSIWYDDDEHTFEALCGGLWRNDPRIGGTAINLGQLTAQYRARFRGDYKTVLLPPKRQVELTAAIDMNGVVSTVGERLLSNLFYDKNQPPGEDRTLYDRTLEAFINISSGYAFAVFALQGNRIALHFSFHDGPWVPADVCGLGLQDLLVILYFSIHPDYKIILIEEPESHLHPDMQRRLLSFLRTLPSKQFFLTTHSNIFLDAGYVDRVFFTSFSDKIFVDDATHRAALLSDLGYAVTDNLVSDLTILVEGPGDVAVLQQYLIKMGVYPNYNIKFWPVGGDIMDKLDLTVFQQGYSLMALLDQDPGSSVVRTRFVRKCEELQIPVTRLSRYAIENYFTVRALREVFGGQISPDFAEINPNTKLEEQIGLNPKGAIHRLARAMTLEEIEHTDDLFDFLSDVRQHCQNGTNA